MIFRTLFPMPILIYIHTWFSICVVLAQRVGLTRLQGRLALRSVLPAPRMHRRLPTLQNVLATQVFIGEETLNF